MLRRFVPYLAGFLSGLLASGLLLIVSSGPRGEPIELLPPPTPRPMRVHVSGEVRAPGVYELTHGAIVAEAIEAAGGPDDEANIEGLNLAAALSDGSRIHVPKEGEGPATAAAVPSDEDPAESGPLHINSATVPELERLPGIGPSLANAIVDYREGYGPFSSPQDLLSVPGIGPAKLAAIEDLIEVP